MGRQADQRRMNAVMAGAREREQAALVVEYRRVRDALVEVLAARKAVKATDDVLNHLSFTPIDELLLTLEELHEQYSQAHDARLAAIQRMGAAWVAVADALGEERLVWDEWEPEGRPGDETAEAGL